MSQSVKRGKPQGAASEVPLAAARQGWARAAGQGVLGEARAGFLRAGFADMSLVLRWPEIVGPQVARLAQPLKWQDNADGAVLTLKCEAGAAVLLQHQTRQIVDALNLYLGANRVARLKFVPGRLAAPSQPVLHPMPDHDPMIEKGDLAAALSRLAVLRNRLTPPRKRRISSPPD